MIKIRASTARRLGTFAVGIMTVAAALSGWKPAAAVSSGTLSLSPSSASVSTGANFTVAVIQTSTSTSSGAQADVVFDRTKLQVTNVARGSAYTSPASGATVGLGPMDTGTFKADAIAAANTSGTLQGTAVYYNPGGGDPTIPAGANQAFVVTFHALSNVSIRGVVGLANPEMLDASGASMVVTAVNSGTLSFSPSDKTVAPGASFTVAVAQTSTSTTSGAQADVVFDRTKIEVTDVARGTAYASPPSGATIGTGALDTPAIKAAAIAAANASGTLQGTAMYYNTPGGDTPVPAGTNQAFVITFHVLATVNATTSLSLTGGEMLDVAGTNMDVSMTSGSITIQPTSVGGVAEAPDIAGGVVAASTIAHGGSNQLPIEVGMLAILCIAGAGAVVWRRAIR